MVDYKSAIIADPKGNAWEFAKDIYKNLEERGSGYELVEIDNKEFRDNEFKAKISKNVRKRNCYFIHDSSKDPSRWLSELAFVNNTLKNASAQTIVDVLPYLKFSRQDRKDESRVCISAQVVADIVGLYSNRLITLDVHNESLQGFYNRPADTLLSHPVVGNYLKKNHPSLLEEMVIGSPDVGGGKRAELFANYMGKDMVMGYKTRKEAGEVQDLDLMGNIKGKNVLFVDDILDSGGTLVKASQKAREKGAKKVGAYITHGLFTKGIEKLESLDYLFVGDTIPQTEKVKNSDKVEIISFVDLFSETIYRADKGESISKLFL